MSTKTLIITGLVIAASSFLAGHYLATNGVSKSITTEQEDTTKITDKNKKVVEVIAPDGTRTITTEENSRTVLEKEKIKQVVLKRDTLNVSVLAGVDSLNSFKPIYGLSVSKQFVGPVTIGLFGFTDSRIGVSLGVNF